MIHERWLDKRYNLFIVVIAELVGAIAGICGSIFSYRLNPDSFYIATIGTVGVLILAILTFILIEKEVKFQKAMEETRKISLELKEVKDV